ncbi:MAG: NAD(P)/FAD-dependent oxidoreductase [Promethearchaeota archaeon]
MFNSKADITIITEETYESHRKPGATMALEFPETRDLIVNDWSFNALSKRNIKIQTGATVLGGNSESKTLQLEGSTTIDYDKLILATGGFPAVPSIPGTNLPEIFTIQNLADTSALGKQLSRMKSIIIVGAGFSGLETAERLLALGKEVHLVVRSRLMRKQLEESMSEELLSRLPERLTVHTGAAPSSIVGEERVEGAIIGDVTIEADAVLFMTGVRPNTVLAESLGAKIGALGGILVDNTMMTSIPDVFAVGDCIELIDPLTNDPFLLPIASVAARAGRQAGVTAAGGTKIYDNIIRRLQYDRIFDTDIVVVGLSSVAAHSLGVKTEVQYWEDQTEFAKVALVANESGRLIGGQVISSRLGARLGYELLERVEAGSSLKERPLLKPQHERFRDYLENAYGPIR